MSWSDYEKGLKLARAAGSVMYESAKRKVLGEKSKEKPKTPAAKPSTATNTVRGMKGYKDSISRTKKALEDFERENR